MTALAGKHRSLAMLSWLNAWNSVSHRLRSSRSVDPRLVIIESITVAPRQTVTLIEAEGERFLVGTAQEGSPQFFRLEAGARKRECEHCAEIALEGTVS